MAIYAYDERDLLQQVAAGDELAFGRLMEQYHVATYRVVMRLMQAPWMAEDVVQEVFLKVWLSRATLPGLDNFQAWLTTVTTHQVYDLVRKQQRESARLQQWQQELHLPDQQGQTATTDYEELVQQAVAKLSPRQQAVFTHLKKKAIAGRKQPGC
ncbi:RNA polymerase sigma factor [Chitinophaga agrisoli]|uniref:RNA polymerase sigma factor n=1 Tax=Chitinophaga agrisoli TaxID=2607653 RepID=A0A5B2VJ55_9BACT|nr:RNA polymerase sigma factor [Chitinophaga agrisoli]KAA2238975.1 RNA polymerase sigma factor [Chitinophaga agrisoli]